jgi:hypothetical protein
LVTNGIHFHHQSPWLYFFDGETRLPLPNLSRSDSMNKHRLHYIDMRPRSLDASTSTTFKDVALATAIGIALAAALVAWWAA